MISKQQWASAKKTIAYKKKRVEVDPRKLLYRVFQNSAPPFPTQHA